MAPADVTRPKDGEFTVVSIPRNCGMFSTFVAWARTSMERPSANENVLFSDRLPKNVDGPRTVFLPAFPNSQAGAVNAALLNHSATEESEICAGRPVAFARKLPLLPRSTSQ